MLSISVLMFLALAVANEVGLGRMNRVIGVFVLGVMLWYTVEQIYTIERKKK